MATCSPHVPAPASSSPSRQHLCPEPRRCLSSPFPPSAHLQENLTTPPVFWWNYHQLEDVCPGGVVFSPFQHLAITTKAERRKENAIASAPSPSMFVGVLSLVKVLEMPWPWRWSLREQHYPFL